MLDIHSHLLFGVDDGSSSIETTQEMLASAAKDGITDIIATPHYSPDNQELIKDNFPKLVELASEQGIKAQLGMEYDLVKLPDITGELQTLGNSKFLLVDLGVYHYERMLLDYLDDLACSGYKIILAHPERLFELNDWSKLQNFYNEGYLFQVNSGSLVNRYGESARKVAFKLLDNGMVSYLANDAHRASGYRFKLVRELLQKKYGEEYCKILFERNSELFLAGKMPEKAQVRKAWYRFGF